MYTLVRSLLDRAGILTSDALLTPLERPLSTGDPVRSGPLRGTLRTVRYARSWKGGAQHVQSTQVKLRREGKAIAATLVLPSETDGPFPGWIALGGVSRKGRFHPQLNRFAEALASTGAAVIVPEIPEWRRLSVCPSVTEPTVRACVEYLNGSPLVVPGRYGAIGFSFGAPSLAVAASQDDLAPHIGGVVLFGGYCSLDRTLRSMIAGQHDWEGARYSLDPDPYGRWVVAANHLTSVPGHEDAADVATALRTLAEAASGQRISAWEPHHDPMIRQLRATIPECRQPLFDQLARSTDSPVPDRDAGLELADKLGKACRRTEPLLDPADALSRVTVPTQVIHGHGDRLVPFTEGLRLMDALPESARRGTTVTRMFNHSKDHAPADPVERVRETAKLFGALRRLINTV